MDIPCLRLCHHVEPFRRHNQIIGASKPTVNGSTNLKRDEYSDASPCLELIKDGTGEIIKRSIRVLDKAIRQIHHFLQKICGLAHSIVLSPSSQKS